MVEWKTISSKIKEEDYGAMKIICEREKITENEFIRRLVEKETSKILNKNQVSPESFPNLGDNKFEYNPDSDSYIVIRSVDSVSQSADGLATYAGEGIVTGDLSYVYNPS